MPLTFLLVSVTENYSVTKLYNFYLTNFYLLLNKDYTQYSNSQ